MTGPITQPAIEAILRAQAQEAAALFNECRKAGLPTEAIIGYQKVLMQAWGELGTCGQPNGECLCKCHAEG